MPDVPINQGEAIEQLHFNIYIIDANSNQTY